jgi:hypothetical protein
MQGPPGTIAGCLPGDDLLAEGGHRSGDLGNALCLVVGDEDTKRGRSFRIVHPDSTPNVTEQGNQDFIHTGLRLALAGSRLSVAGPSPPVRAQPRPQLPADDLIVAWEGKAGWNDMRGSRHLTPTSGNVFARGAQLLGSCARPGRGRTIARRPPANHLPRERAAGPIDRFHRPGRWRSPPFPRRAVPEPPGVSRG